LLTYCSIRYNGRWWRWWLSC